MKAKAVTNKSRLLLNYTKKTGTESLRMQTIHKVTSEDKARIKAQMEDLRSGRSLQSSLRKQLACSTRNLLWAVVNLTTRILSETRKWTPPFSNRIEKLVSLVRSPRKTIFSDYPRNYNLDLKSHAHQKVGKDLCLVSKTFPSNNKRQFLKLRGK